MAEITRPNIVYEFSRVSYPIVAVCGGVGTAFLVYALSHPTTILGWLGVSCCIAVALNFYAIKVSVDRDTLLILYGIGFIAREFALHSIVGFDMVENYSLHSLYNPHAERTPCLRLRDGAEVILPVTDSRKLSDVLRLRRA